MTIDSDSNKFNSALRSAVVWPLAVIFAAAVALAVLLFQMLDVIKWSDHSYKVLAETRLCEDKMVASQNDVRGFLLTGDPIYTQKYEAKRDAAVADLLKIQQLVSDNPEQTANIKSIIDAKDTWFEHARIMISSRSPGMPANPEWVRMGTTILDDIDARFERFIAKEIELRDQRLAKVRQMKTALAYVGGVLAFLVSLTILHQVRKQMMQLAGNYRTALATIEQRHAALARSESDLEEQKEWLRVTLTSIGDGVIVTDPAGRVVLMNHESERLTGWSQADALHQPLTTVFHIVNEDTRAAMPDPVAKVLQEKKVIGLANHTVLISRHGEDCPIEDSAAPITDAKGAILGVVLVFHDATVMRGAQRTLKAHSTDLEKTVAERTTALQQSLSELEGFSYTVSHDLRAPLRAMQGFSEALLEDYSDKLDEEGRHYLERIKTAGVRLDHLIQDLLAYTRISRQETPLEVLDLDKIVRDSIEIDPGIKAAAGQITIEGPLPKVMARESSLSQVVTNLLGNAVKFVADGSAPKVRVHAETNGPRVRLWIEDSGIGIDPTNHERIFEMFTQAIDPARYGGTGVGLAIVRKAMQTMRGNVGLESTDGQGSRFWIELAKA